MKQDNSRMTNAVICLIGCIPVIWLALLVAPYVEGGLSEIIMSSEEIIAAPFHIRLCEGSLKTAILFLIAYGMGIGIYF